MRLNPLETRRKCAVVPAMKLTGEEYFPPQPQKNKVTLMLCNHVSDIDQILIMSKIRWWDETATPVKFTSFTYESFSHVPVWGSVVGRDVIALQQKEPQEDIEAKVEWFFSQDYNLYLLFPEGTLIDKISYKKSLDHQKQLQIPESQWFHHLLYPYARALNAFLKVIGTRLTYIVDLTLEYQDVPAPHLRSRSMLANPSACYSLLCGLKPVSLDSKTYAITPEHCRSILDMIQPHSLDAPLWLKNLWMVKEKRLRRNKRKQLTSII
jgi:hypothetical protein